MLWLLLLILLVGSAAVSASETALFRLDRQSLSQCRQSKNRWRHRVWTLMQSPRRVLMTVLMANTAVNVAIFSLSFFLFRSLSQLPPWLSVMASLAAPISVIIFGEMLPKATALTHARKMAPLAGALIDTLQFILAPLRWVLGVFLVEPITRLLAPLEVRAAEVSTDELKLLVEQSAHEGVITSSENEMLQAVVALGEVSVREVMTPRVDIQAVASTILPEDLIRYMGKSKRRRIPVFGENLDDIQGMLYARTFFLNPQTPVRKLMRQVRFIPEQANLIQVLRHFREEAIHIAIIVDEYGGTAGLVTIDDVLQHLIGELPDDDSTRAVTMERIDENTYRLSGNLSVRDWADRFGVDEVDRHIDTLAGLLLTRIGRLPKQGDTVHVRNLTLTVETMNHRRIATVLLKRSPPMNHPSQEASP